MSAPTTPSTLPSTIPHGSAKTGGTTPVPNALFDVVLPTLSDTQLRVLLIVARSTLGWRAGESRKERDWLSHRQLQNRTGRAGAAVSGAIDVLVRRGLLEVQDREGAARDTTSARRAVRGPLFYRLGKMLAPQRTPTSQSEFDMLTARKDGEKSYSASNYEHTIPELGKIGTASTSQTGLHKSKTTKEKGTKELREELKNGTEITLDLSSLGSEVLRVGEEQLERLGQVSSRPMGNRIDRGFAANEASREKESSLPSLRFWNKEPNLAGIGSGEMVVNEEIVKGENVSGETLSKGPIGDLSQRTFGQNSSQRDAADAFIRRFESVYAEARSDQSCPPIESEDYDMLVRYLESYGAPYLERWLSVFFASDFGYVRRRSWSLASYLNSLFVLQAKNGQAVFRQRDS